nr:hypothetical protein BACY1_08590 [Tenacibaculum mesophilum]
MTEPNVKKAGFEFEKEYEHDQFYTRRYKKGVMQVEFTYLSEKSTLENVDLTIDEVIAETVDYKELLMLDMILNK